MRWEKKERVIFGSECTSMLITRSCCIDCQGAFHVIRQLRFFGVSSAN